MGCIYMYTNQINGMKYIGQTIAPLKKRHLCYLSGRETYFDRALHKYGQENFDLEVLEDGIFDRDILDQREMYYIEKYDTFNNGYNLTLGGGGGKTFDICDASAIIEMIRHTDLTFKEIGEKTGYSVYTISDINNGYTARQTSEDYPIRKHKCTQKYTIDDAYIVIDLLENTSYSFAKIAEISETSFSYVCDVNRGKVSYINYADKSIPIRPNKAIRPVVTKEIVNTVISLLKSMDVSAEQIADKVGLTPYTVGQINRGKLSICKEFNESFPIQKRQYRNKLSAQQICASLSIEQVQSIIDDILNTKCTFEEIGRRYGVCRGTIDRINRKVTWSNVSAKYKAPIRTNPYNKQFQS